MMVEIDKTILDGGNWDLACKNPINFTQNAVGAPILSHWGIRFWDSGNRATSKERASRATLNILVAKTDVLQGLRTSGRNMWISPRNGQEEFTKYHPVWLQISLAEVRIQHDRLAQSAGIVKGRTGFAFRSPLEHLDEIRQTLLPGSSPQPHLGPPSEIHLYKISPTPLNATRDDVVAFLAKNLTQCKSAIRRQLGPRGMAHSPRSTDDQ